MAIPTRATSHGTFFITTQTAGRRSLFQVEATAQLFLDTLQHYRREGHYKLWAFIVMPDHVHLLLTPTETLEKTVQLIKGGFSHKLGSKFPFWQRGFTDRRMRDRADFDTHRNYIHDNPVRARLCQRPEDYAFSSAFHKPTLAAEAAEFQQSDGMAKAMPLRLRSSLKFTSTATSISSCPERRMTL